MFTQKSLNDQRGCLLKFSGELGQTSREDFHQVFADHGKIKWIDFIRGAKEVRSQFEEHHFHHLRFSLVDFHS